MNGNGSPRSAVAAAITAFVASGALTAVIATFVMIDNHEDAEWHAGARAELAAIRVQIEALHRRMDRIEDEHRGAFP